MFSKLKNDKGFTLLEAIISIAVLSILSVFILQMFIVSERANTKAQDMDLASAKIMSYMETFKSKENAEAFKTEFEGKAIAIDEKDSNYNITMLFDEHWEEVSVAENLTKSQPNGYAKNVKFALKIFVEKEIEEKVTDAKRGNLYKISAEVLSVNEPVDFFGNNGELKETSLVAYETSKYFPLG